MVRPNFSHEAEVERARLDLIELLRDPYYYEAALRMKRSGKLSELLADRGGNPAIGTIARDLQWPSMGRGQKREGPGRPKKTGMRGFEMLLDRIQERPLNVSLAELCRRIVSHERPTLAGKQYEMAWRRLYTTLRNLKARRSGKR